MQNTAGQFTNRIPRLVKNGPSQHGRWVGRATITSVVLIVLDLDRLVARFALPISAENSLLHFTLGSKDAEQ